MSITFACPSCKKAYSVAENFAGRQIRCRDCQTVVTIPGAAKPAAAAPPAASRPALKTFSDPGGAQPPRPKPAVATPPAVPRSTPPPPPPPPVDDDLYALAPDAWEDVAPKKPGPVDDELPPAREGSSKSGSGRKRGQPEPEASRSPVVLIASIAAGLVACVVAFLVVSSLSRKKEPAAPAVAALPGGALADHQRVTTEGIAAIDAATAALSRVQAPDDLQREFQPLTEAIMKIGQLATEAQLLTALSEQDDAKLRMDFGGAREQAVERLRTERDRVRNIAGMAPMLAPLGQLGSAPG